MTEQEQIDFLSQIIKANRLHESHCPAFNPHKGDFANMFQSLTEQQCHCWLDQDNCAPYGGGFAAYHIENKKIDGEAYINRYYAVQRLLSFHPEVSEDTKAENYWGKTYYIVPVTTTAKESTE